MTTIATHSPTRSASRPEAAPRLPVWTHGLVAAVVASVATTALAALASAAGVSFADRTGAGIPIAGFTQLTLVFSLIGVAMAAVMARRARNPRRLFVRTAVTLTALSVVPDLTFGFDAASAVAAEYAGPPSSAGGEVDAAEEFDPDGISAELRYGADGEYDGDSLVVAVGTGLDESLMSCDSMPTYVGHCADVDGGVLFWEEVAPEEDPGVVYLIVPKGEASVLMFYSGPVLSGDPRDLDLPVSVDTMMAIAQDPRVDLTTTQAALDAGEALDAWHD